MQDERNYCEYEQQVDQSARHMKHSKAPKPSYQQHHE